MQQAFPVNTQSLTRGNVMRTAESQEFQEPMASVISRVKRAASDEERGTA